MAKRAGSAQVRRNPHGGAPAGGALAKVREILERIDAILKAAKEVRSDIQQHPGFAEIGERMVLEWEIGSATPLRR